MWCVRSNTDRPLCSALPSTETRPNRQQSELRLCPGQLDHTQGDAHTTPGSTDYPVFVEITAERFVGRLDALPTPVRMGDIFALAREFIDLPLDDIDQLLQSPAHHQRVGGLSIMGK